jgi:two-component system, chemotaxis family, protein-glutamate methylesterase/glutaminase
MTSAGRGARVLVCDGAADYARSLARFLDAGDQLDVVGVCTTGEEALRQLPRLAPDLLTVDLDVGGMGGVRVIEAIMRRHPLPIVALSAGAGRGSERAAEALAAGALEALPKSQVRLDEPNGPRAIALRHRLRRLARTRASADPAAAKAAPPAEELPRGHATVVAICASTGGPKALEVVLRGLPADFPLPVLVVQHMAVGFMDGLIRWLGPRVPLPVGVAGDGQELEAGIWFPPDDVHLLLRAPMRVELDGDTVVGPHRPSADLLLKSVASAAGRGAAGVVLTGMGRDGAAGAAAIRAAGGYVIAQDEESSVVFGMPRAAVDAGADTVLPLAQIPSALRRLATVEALR